MDQSLEETREDLSWYLLALTRTIPEVDEEVFDHRMNLVRQYRNTLKRVLPYYGKMRQEEQERIRESIRGACREKILIADKYTAYC